VYIYGSYRKNKIGVPFFGPPCKLTTDMWIVNNNEYAFSHDNTSRCDLGFLGSYGNFEEAAWQPNPTAQPLNIIIVWQRPEDREMQEGLILEVIDPSFSRLQTTLSSFSYAPTVQSRLTLLTQRYRLE